MVRAAKACTDPACPNLQPCPDHQRKPWQGSRRAERLRKRSGSRQAKLRRFVLARDDNVCHVCEAQFPDHQLVNDHVISLADGGEDHVDNMAPCCTGPGTNGCHDRKTAEEARRGRAC